MEYLTFPYRLTQAILRGLGRLVIEQWQDSAFRGNPYVEMSEEQRCELEGIPMSRFINDTERQELDQITQEINRGTPRNI